MRDIRGAITLALLGIAGLSSARMEARGAAEEPPYRIYNWQVEDGLPQSSVTSILQTQDGYLWFGTFGGLVRFDGVQFKVFTPEDTPGLTSRRILQLFQDRAGALWIGTEEGDVVRYEEGKFEAWSLPVRGKYIRAFAETGDRTLLMLNSARELLRFAGGIFSFATTNQWELPGTRVNGLGTDSNNHVWVCTDNEIGQWQDGRFGVAWGQAGEEQFHFGLLSGGRHGACWVAASGHVRKLEQGRWTADYGAFPWSKGDLYCMLEDRQGQLWVGTYGSGLYRYQTNGAVFHLSTANGLPGDIVRSLCQDREGNIWVGMEGHGLARLTPVMFRSYGRQQGLSGDAIMTVCEGDDGEVWIGANGDGIDRLKDGEVRHYGPAQGLTNECAWSVLQDRQRRLWVGTWGGGLFLLEDGKFRSFPTTAEDSDVACALFEDSKGTVWVGQQRSRPELVELRNGKAEVCSLPSLRGNLDVRVITEDAAGALWIGTQGQGLYRLKDGACARLGKKEGLDCDLVRALYAETNGVVWIGTRGGGLYRFAGGRFHAFTTREGLASDEITFITEDARGNLWCKGGGGVFRVAKEELNRHAADPDQPIRCFNYTKSDGLPSVESSGGCQPAGCKTRDGRLWFPTLRGLAVVDPEKVTVNPVPPPVIIEEVVLEGKTKTLLPRDEAAEYKPEPLRIPPGVQHLDFRYTGLSLTAPAKVRFKYRLEGLEEKWIDAGTQRVANYGRPAPGNYRFCVLACNNDGVWNENGASQAIVVLPNFWQTWWFRILAGAAVALLLGLAYELRLASERKLLRLRLRIARDLHDEVGSNLGSIALLSEVMPKQPGGATEEVTEIRRIAQQTIASLRDIVWFLDPAGDNLGTMLPRMKETARTMLSGVAFEFRSSGREDLKTSLELRRNVFLMFKEILHNIVKHARATKVDIEVEVNPRQFQLRVSDNGVGFDETTVRGGNGLKNLRRRAADVRGTVEIESRPGRGTVIRFHAPLT